MRVGMGYDLHRLVEGRRCVLGGVEIPWHPGPEGHSDGDALLHAIIDALLGAAALGDIGAFFPPSDPRWRDADSAALLGEVAARLDVEGWRVENVDSTVVLERPKLAPHLAAMRARIAAVLGVALDRVSVKAKTNEGLGAIGAGDAVAAQAVALIERK
ncbi:MAG TPA: 2-C-methyl-D-erythritol 2,4-cyclodiphosphate synthase [Dehalococcoidia bacterium]|nr:2-C-methyl-D-erythritol 2,4-cyclodiphosphate synthase [Dehalococcoidia bacterium]